MADFSELKNNWSLWKRAKSFHLALNQTELKVEFPIPITACNFMFDLDSFLCNECGYSKYSRFEFTFMANPSFTFDNMENDEDMNEFSE